MSDVKLIVNIPRKVYKAICDKNALGCDIGDIKNIIRNSTLLPKGYGRLGDLDALREEVSSWGMNDYEPSDFIDAIDQADTIIEADKEQE
jgi:hypothetical protein